MLMLNPILAFITAFLVSYAFLPFIIRFSKKKKIGARPGRRRIHKRITPSLGGAAIFLGFTFSCLIWGFRTDASLVLFTLSILIIPFIIGLLDDLIHLKPSAKLIAQWITASLIFFILNVRLTSLYGLAGDAEFPVWLSYLLTVFTVIIITNSLNLIDGIDGLAATFSLIACLFFGTWFFFVAQYSFALLCLALAGGILAFLFQNWAPSNIFMGDTGSLVIGTLLSLIMIHFLNDNQALDNHHPAKFQSSIGTAICVMIVPLVDTARIIIVRLSKGISPFTADKRHIHHGLIRLGFTHQKAVYVLAVVHVTMIAMAILFRHANQFVILGLVVAVSVALCLWLDSELLRWVKDDKRSEDPTV